MMMLTDTNALLWTAYAPQFLTSKARAALESAEQRFYSIINLWEIALKISRGGFDDLEVPDDWEKSLVPSLHANGFGIVSLTVPHCRMIQDLPFHHKDPFDRMLIAQALVEKLEVVGSDERFDDYGVTRVW